MHESEESNLLVPMPWNRCLPRVFGTTFQQLGQVSHLLRDSLGGVARIYKNSPKFSQMGSGLPSSPFRPWKCLLNFLVASMGTPPET